MDLRYTRLLDTHQAAMAAYVKS